MIGGSSVAVAGEQGPIPRYEDAVGAGRTVGRGVEYTDSDVPGRAPEPTGLGRELLEEGRPVSPVSVVSPMRRSFESRSVSPESINRVPLGDAERR